MGPTAVAKALDVPLTVFSRWMKARPALQEVFSRAKTPSNNHADHLHSGERVVDFVYRRLSPECQKIWTQIEHIDGGPMGEEDDNKRKTRAWDRIEKLFSYEGGKRARQSLYIHALFASNFNGLAAAHKVCISPTTLREWCKEPAFKELIKQVEEMKAELIRASAFRLVAAGEPSLIRYLGDRLVPEFKPPSQTIKHEGEIRKLTAKVDLNDALDQLPLEDRIKILEKIRMTQQREPLELPHHADE